MINKLHKNLKDLKSRKAGAGFTIIEVLIVLAIAGLILLIVFLAVPALQRNSRNTAIKNDVQNVVGGVSEYQGANNGALPTSVSGTGEIKYEGSGNSTSIKIQGSTVVTSNKSAPSTGDGSKPEPGSIVVSLGYRCDGTKSARAVSAVYTIETTSGTVSQCTES
jgi:prepilin-type N-terminal cleavage/methylation domain-containing protein